MQGLKLVSVCLQDVPSSHTVHVSPPSKPRMHCTSKRHYQGWVLNLFFLLPNIFHSDVFLFRKMCFSLLYRAGYFQMNCLNWKLSLYSFSSKHRKRKLQSLFHSLWFLTLIFCWVWVSQKHSFHHSPTSVFLCVFFVVFFPLPKPYCIKVRGQRPRSNPSSHWTDHQAK